MERTRRLRTSNYMRDMVRENHVRIDELIYPIFVTEGENIKHPVESMPGIYQYSLDRLSEVINIKMKLEAVHMLKMELCQRRSARSKKSMKNF